MGVRASTDKARDDLPGVGRAPTDETCNEVEVAVVCEDIDRDH